MSWDGNMHDKYRVSHTDGTPLKGKKYFVLRLDSDDPVEAARVSAAMRAYKGELRNCDVGTADEQNYRHGVYCSKHDVNGDMEADCAHNACSQCILKWCQMPYEE